MGEVILKSLQTSFKYRVVMIGMNTTTSVRVQKVTTPEAATISERVHYEQGNKYRLGGTKSIDDNLTLEAVIPNQAGNKEFYNLLQQISNSDTGQSNLPQIYFKTISIQELNELNAPVRTQMFRNCVLHKYELPDFDAGASENAIEKLIFFVNGHRQI